MAEVPAEPAERAAPPCKRWQCPGQAKRLLVAALWLVLAVALVASVAVVALHRGERINALWLVVAGACAAALGYRFYAGWLAATVLAIDPDRATPAVTRQDGRDFVPTSLWVVFGHHFAAIAGPGPLVGPVLAAQFGYLPSFLWILIGATLGGGVHDAVVLFCSVRRGGRSLGQMLTDEVSRPVGIVASVSMLAIIVILLAVLALVVVKALAESPWGLFTIAMTVPLALAMGIGHTKLQVSVRTVTVLGVFGLLLSVWAGSNLRAWGMEALFDHSGEVIAVCIMAYGFAASVAPVWLLLAPRDYLSTFMKMGTVLVLAVAVVFVAPDLHMPKVTSFVDGSGPVFSGTVFPFIFITIACGAISGFHALVSSGTTPKMLDREDHIQSVGYGAMIAEMLVALVALVAACALEPGQYFAINAGFSKTLPPHKVVEAITQAGYPVTVEDMDDLAHRIGERSMFGRAGGAPTFAVGTAHIFTHALGQGAEAFWYHFAIMFEALFILTTIDAGTRVGRFMLQDLLSNIWKPQGRMTELASDVVASALLVASWGYFLYQGVVDPLGGINSLWPIFGIANQLLAVIAFCLGTTVLIKMGRVRYLPVTVVPLVLVMASTFSAGIIKVFDEDPRLGFLASARHYGERIAAGGTVEQLATWSRLRTTGQLDAAITGLFVVSAGVVVLGCAVEWARLLAGAKKAELMEDPYVHRMASLPAAAPMGRAAEEPREAASSPVGPCVLAV